MLYHFYSSMNGRNMMEEEVVGERESTRRRNGNKLCEGQLYQ